MTDYFSESAKGERETKTYEFSMLVRVRNTTARGPKLHLSIVMYDTLDTEAIVIIRF